MKKVWFFLLIVSCHTIYGAEKKEGPKFVWAGIALNGNFKNVSYKDCEENNDIPLVNSLRIMRQSNTYCFCPVTFYLEPHILVDEAVAFTLKDAQKFADAVQKHTESKTIKNCAKTPQKDRPISIELISFDGQYRLVYTPYQGYPGYACIRYCKKYKRACLIL